MTAPNTTLPKIDLYCTTGGANKEYHLSTVANADGTFALFYANGSIGAAMKPKVKTGPTTLLAVQKEFDKTVKSKTTASPPYTEASSGVAYAVSEDAGQMSGWLPQLLTEVQPENADVYFSSPEWAAQEKMMGERRGVRIKDGDVRGMNKKGRFVGGVPQKWVDALTALPDDSILDGEHIADTLYVFDATRIGGEDLTARPLAYREAMLQSYLAGLNEPTIQMLRMEQTEEGKRALHARVLRSMGEGLVFKRLSASYTPGSASNVRSADSVKLKFYESSSCIVIAKNAGRSVAVALLNADGSLYDAGSVTIPANHPIPAPDSIVEVRYMHMIEGGKLYGPPVYLGERNDVDRDECTLAQVKRVLSRAQAALAEDDVDSLESDPAEEAHYERARG